MAWCWHPPARYQHWGRHKMADSSHTHFQIHFLNEDIWISIDMSWKCVPKGKINNIPTLAQLVVCRPPRGKSLSEPMIVSLLTYICVTQPHWVNQWPPILRTHICVSLQSSHNEPDGVLNHQPHDCLLNRLFRCRSKKTLKLCVIDLCVGNSPASGEFPAQRASNAENVSIWWRHHALAKTEQISCTSLCIIDELNHLIWFMIHCDSDKATL